MLLVSLTTYIARLDPNGNEIPADEEEELERNRSQGRVRALYNARATASSTNMQPDTTTLMPITRTSIYEANEEENVARVRINAQDSTRYMMSPAVTLGRSRHLLDVPNGHRSAHLDAEMVVPYLPDMFGSSIPFLVDPLPMPLDDMVTFKSLSSHVDRGRGLVVPRQTIWAGR